MSIHGFEFMDLESMPAGLRTTLREILECGNAKPFRPYYEWVANSVKQMAKQNNCQRVVELGAGTGPITRHLAADPEAADLQLVVTDFNPDHVAYKKLEQDHSNVRAVYECVDFSQPREWGTGTLVYLSATFHHIPKEERVKILRALTASADRVVIFEPLRRTLLSYLFVLPSLVPALLLPFLFLGRPGFLRRLLWCGSLIAPLTFWWDGLISCMRQWNASEWQAALSKVGEDVTIDESLFCQRITWTAQKTESASDAGEKLVASVL